MIKLTKNLYYKIHLLLMFVMKYLQYKILQKKIAFICFKNIIKLKKNI